MKKFFKLYSPDEGGVSGASASTADTSDSLFESIEGSAAGNNAPIIDGLNAVNATDSEGKPLKSSLQVDDEPATEDFLSLINGKYQKEYQQSIQKEVNSRVKTAFNKRFKNHMQTSERLQRAEESLTSLKPLIDAMASRYGLDPKNIKAIVEAADKDDSNFEREAAEKGFGDTDTYRRHLKNERELNDFREKDRAQKESAAKQQDRQRLVDGWLNEAGTFKKDFPEFDFKAEWEGNDRFRYLLTSGWSVKEAYAAVHPDDYAKTLAKQAERAVIQEVRANNRRPAEGGAGVQGALRVTKSLEDLSHEDLQKIRSEAKRGKKIRF